MASNGDKIRMLNNKELSDWIFELLKKCKTCEVEDCIVCDLSACKNCKNVLLNWLDKDFKEKYR